MYIPKYTSLPKKKISVHSFQKEWAGLCLEICYTNPFCQKIFATLRTTKPWDHTATNQWKSIRSAERWSLNAHLLVSLCWAAYKQKSSTWCPKWVLTAIWHIWMYNILIYYIHIYELNTRISKMTLKMQKHAFQPWTTWKISCNNVFVHDISHGYTFYDGSYFCYWRGWQTHINQQAEVLWLKNLNLLANCWSLGMLGLCRCGEGPKWNDERYMRFLLLCCALSSIFSMKNRIPVLRFECFFEIWFESHILKMSHVRKTLTFTVFFCMHQNLKDEACDIHPIQA